jgi:hypothetical protein
MAFVVFSFGAETWIVSVMATNAHNGYEKYIILLEFSNKKYKNLELMKYD